MGGAAHTRWALMDAPRVRLVANYHAPRRDKVYRDGDDDMGGALAILEVVALKKAEQKSAALCKAAGFHV